MTTGGGGMPEIPQSPRVDVAAEAAKAAAKDAALAAEAVQAKAAEAAAQKLENPPTQDLADLEQRLETADTTNPLEVMQAGQLGNEQRVGSQPTPTPESTNSVSNVPDVAASELQADVANSGAGGLTPAATSPEAGASANSPAETPEKSVQQPATGGSAPDGDENPTARQEPAAPTKPIEQRPTSGEQPPSSEPPTTAVTGGGEAITPNLPPPDANAANPAEAEAARVAKEKSDYMNGLVNADSQLKTMLENAGIVADPTKGFDVDKLVEDLENKGDARNLAEDRALRRLREVQGLTTLHEGQQEMDALLKSGKDVTKGEGEREFDKAKGKIEKGRMAEMQKTLREKIYADEELKSWLRQTYPDRELEDIDGPQLIKTLRERQPGYYHNNADLMNREQKILDRLGAYAGEKKQEYGLEDGMRARNDEERLAAIEQVAEGERSQPSAFRKFREKISRGFSGLSHEELQYLGRQAKSYNKTLKSFEERLRVAEKKGDVSGADGLRDSIKHLKELSSSANKEWRTKSAIKFFLILFILNTLALTIGPALLAAKGLQLMGKAQQ